MPCYRTLSALAGLLASIWYISTTSKPLRLNWHIYQFAAKDHCFGNPCLNNGTCQSNPENYTCSCPPSYTGKSCEGLLNKKRPQQNLTEPNAHFSLLCLVYSGVLELSSYPYYRAEALVSRNCRLLKNTQYNEVHNTMRHRVFLPCLSFDLQSEIIVIATLADIMEHVTIFLTITSANVLQDWQG